MQFPFFRRDESSRKPRRASSRRDPVRCRPPGHRPRTFEALEPRLLLKAVVNIDQAWLDANGPAPY